MLLWSKGLGTKTLTLNLGEGVPKASSDGLLIKGTIKEPVWWDYLITMTEQDVIDVLQVAVTKETVAYLQSVEHPWAVFGKLVVAAVRFFMLWMVASIGSPLSKRFPKKSRREAEEEATAEASEAPPKAIVEIRFGSR